jgi:hypothetical protein
MAHTLASLLLSLTAALPGLLLHLQRITAAVVPVWLQPCLSL